LKHILTAIFAIVALLSVSLLWKESYILTVVLGITAMCMLLVNKSKHEIYLFFLSGMAGAFAEAIAISAGAWTYTLPTLIGVPIWLPVLWGIAAVFIVRTYKFIEMIFK